MLKLIKKITWMKMKDENMLLKEALNGLEAKLANAEADNANLQEKIDAWQEKKPYCGRHCQGCKHGYATQDGIFGNPVYGCYLNAENDCYLFTRKEVEEAGK